MCILSCHDVVLFYDSCFLIEQPFLLMESDAVFLCLCMSGGTLDATHMRTLSRSAVLSAVILLSSLSHYVLDCHCFTVIASLYFVVFVHFC